MRQTTPQELEERGFRVGPPAREECVTCPHIWGLHVLSAAGSPLDGGIYTCPEPECRCEGTWSTPMSGFAHPN